MISRRCLLAGKVREKVLARKSWRESPGRLLAANKLANFRKTKHLQCCNLNHELAAYQPRTDPSVSTFPR
jgi:hypothetical protein